MIISVMIRQLAAAILAAGLTAGAVVADDVHLANGESFEGVIASREGDQVLIQLEFGEIKLPATSVLGITESRSALSEYLDRHERLVERGASGAEWAELALWARARELDHGFRQSIFRAAELEPDLEVLKPEMRRLGYVLDPELDQWITYEAHMARSGFVRCYGQWMSAEECRALSEERRAKTNSDEVDVALSKTVELLAAAQLERELRETEESRREARVPAGPYAPYGFPVAYFPGGYYGPPHVQPLDSGEGRPATSIEDVIRRPPGSLIPVGGVNRGRIRQPGSLLPIRGSY